MSLIRLWLKVREQSGHMPQGSQPREKGLDAVIKDPCRNLPGRRKRSTGNDPPTSSKDEDDGCRQTQLRFENQAAQRESGGKFPLIAQQRKSDRKAGESERTRLPPRDQIEKSREGQSHQGHRPAEIIEGRTRSP